MEYNKTKRNLEKAAGIVGVVLSAIGILTAFVCFIIYLNVPTITFDTYNGIFYDFGGFYIFSCVMEMAICIVTIILSAKVIKTPLKADGTLVKRQGIRISLLVFSILSANLVTAGLIIAVLCLKDFKQPKTEQTTVSQPIQHQSLIGQSVAQNNDTETETEDKASLELNKKLKELKHLKELGIVDELTYKKGLAKIIGDYLKEQ